MSSSTRPKQHRIRFSLGFGNVWVSSFLPPLTRSCLKPRQPPLRGSVLWTALQTPISTITASPRPPCSGPSTEGSLLSPKSGLPTAASKQVKPLSLPMQTQWRSSITFFFFLLSFVFPRLSTGSNAESSTAHTNNQKRGTQLRQPQPLLYITTTGAGSQRTRRH